MLYDPGSRVVMMWTVSNWLWLRNIGGLLWPR